MFLKDCKDHFNTDNLYAILHIKSKTPTNAEIKKAYYKQSMKHHPDKVSGDDAKANATLKFQLISKAYSILCDKEKRALYDETGITIFILLSSYPLQGSGFICNYIDITTQFIRFFVII
uniref:J domain-containing protein n=1 Tax=Heterorhabditis bacteriophora TaxID=37862 RepID=A0A1I7XUI5_HETBA